MNLKHLTDKTLLADTKQIVRYERSYITQVLWHLKEIDSRRLYSDLGYTSLFDYCLKELSYSESSAQRRIVAARALKDMPELAPKIESGELSLANISLVQSSFMPEDRSEMMKQVANKSGSEAKEIVRKIKNLPKTYNVTMDESTYKLWIEMQNLGVDLKQVVVQAKKTKLSSPLKREVFTRDHEKCQQCGSKRRLEFDHRRPKALGGQDTAKNLRVLCRNCNQRKRVAAGLSRPNHLRSGSRFSATDPGPSWPSEPQDVFPSGPYKKRYYPTY